MGNTERPPAALVALGATVGARFQAGHRTLPVEDLIVDYYQTRLEPDEILTRITVPDLAPRAVSKYIRVSARSVMEEPTVTVAARALPNGDGALKELRLALVRLRHTPSGA